MDGHQQKVQQVAAQVKDFSQKQQKFRIFHGSTNSTRNQLKDQKNVVDTSSLNRVLLVDTAKRVALVEPNVPMDRLVEATLVDNLIPPVVMDFPGITAGGGYAGTACESSSFKHGFFDRTINRVEMILANGDIVHCSNGEHADLFRGAAAAMGTLGVVTLLEIRLEEAKKYVETTYHPVSSIEEAVSKIQLLSSEHNRWDYIDGILYSATSGAIITGRRTDVVKPGSRIQRFSASTDPWYAFHVQERISGSSEAVMETIPLPEYLFRYDRGGFWVAYDFWKASPTVPFNTSTRKWMDEFCHTRMLYAALHTSVSGQIIQDMAVPYQSATDFLNWVARDLQIWPLWLCPLKQSPHPTIHPHSNIFEADGRTLAPLLNIGIWGAPKILSWDYYFECNAAIDDKLYEVGGQKWMYGINTQSDEDFWRSFDKEWYDGLREKYHAAWMPSIADKARTSRKKVEDRLDVHWSEALPFMIPGISMVYRLWLAWRTNEWKWKRESTWVEWVPRGEENR